MADLAGLDDEDDRPVAPPPSRVRTAPAPASPAPAPKTMLYALVGVGGVAALLLVVVLVLLVRSGGQGDASPSAPQAGGSAARALAAARSDPAPEPPAEVETASAPAAGAEPPKPVFLAASPSPASPAVESTPSYSSESPAAMIQRVKAATVYIKVKYGKGGGTGSGFVVKSEAGALLVATNRHVVAHHLDPEESGAAPGEKPVVSVVFRSSEGAGVEQEVPAQIVAIDTDPGANRDLAVLAVRGVNNAPRPIDLGQKVQPVEGMEARIFGFPFGRSLNTVNRGNPAITVNKGSVSALQRDDLGRLAMIQIDGSVNPGNSGGPIVDEKGRLLGVTTLKSGLADNIGWAIPAAELNLLMAGRVGEIEFSAVSIQPSMVGLHFKATLADPLGRLRAVAVNVAPASGSAPANTPGAGGSVSPLVNGRNVPLTIDRANNVASGLHQVLLGGQGPRRVWIQLTFQNGEGKTILTPPESYDIPAAPGPLVALSNRGKALADRIRKTLGKLGPVIDPDKDCQVVRDDKGIKITIPGKLHTISPQIRDRKNQPVHNAPMALAEIEGDFLAHVRVAGEMQPGNEAASDPKGRRLPLCVQGGGLLLWQDKDNFLRLERSCGTSSGSLTVINRLILEVCKNGQDAGRSYVDIDRGPLHVLLLREKGQIRCLFSNNPKEGWKAFKELAVDFPAKVSIGVSAFNTSKKPYTAQFEDFVLVDDKDKFDDELNKH
jgi:S1-C subfamily serine protease